MPPLHDSGPRAPAVHRRAPLRHVRCPVQHRRRDRVLPPFIGGLHCGAPPCARLRQRTGVTCLPPVTGGLHCGASRGVRPADDAVGVPADHRRAPLRPDAVPAPRRTPKPVFPPITGGLHCGTLGSLASHSGGSSRPQGRAPLRRAPRVSAVYLRPVRHPRPSGAGSIAAQPREIASRVTASGHPAPQGRAPLRLVPRDARHSVQVRRHPASSAAGSIAAPAYQHPAVAWFLSPPLLAGSIAARPGCAASVTQRVTPPLRGGLHCGNTPARAGPVPDRLPAPHGRAPLRRHGGPRVRRWAYVPSPRSSGAAPLRRQRPRWYRRCLFRESPRSSGAGSIAA